MDTVANAVKACPELVVVDGEDLTPYRRANREIQAVLRNCLSSLPSPLAVPIERLGLDEFFLDVSSLADTLVSRQDGPRVDDGYRSPAAGKSRSPSWNAVFMERNLFALLDHINLDDLSDPADACRLTHFCPQPNVERREVDAYAAGALLAVWLRGEIKRALRFTCSAGVAETKLAAKLASGFHKPDDQSAVIGPAALEPFLAALPARKLTGLGHRTLDTVLEHLRRECGVELGHDVTVGDLRKHVRPGTWTVLFGERRGRIIDALTCGLDSSPVVNSRRARQHSVEDSFPSNESRCASWPAVEASLTNLVEHLIALLEEEEFDAKSGRWERRARTLRLTVRLRQNSCISRENRPESRSVPMPSGTYHISEHRRDRAQTVVIGTLVPLLRSWLPPTFDICVLNVAAVGFPEDPATAAGVRDISSFMISEKRTARRHVAAKAKRPCLSDHDMEMPPVEQSDVSQPLPLRDDTQKTPQSLEGSSPDVAGNFTCNTCGVTLPEFCSLPHRLFHAKEGA